MPRQNGKMLSPKSKSLLNSGQCEDEYMYRPDEIVCQNESNEFLNNEIKEICKIYLHEKDFDTATNKLYFDFLSGIFSEKKKEDYRKEHFPEMPESTFYDKVNKVQRNLRKEIFPLLLKKGFSLEDFSKEKRRQNMQKQNKPSTTKTKKLSDKDNSLLKELALYVQRDADAVIGSQAYLVKRKENLPLEPKLVRPVIKKLISLAEEGLLLDSQNFELMFYWAVYCCESDRFQKDILETVIKHSGNDVRRIAICWNFLAIHEVAQNKFQNAFAMLEHAENINPTLPLTQYNKACVYCLRNDLKNASLSIQDLCELLSKQEDNEYIVSFIELFGTDPDLEPIRNSKYKGDLVQKFDALISPTSTSKDRVRRALELILIVILFVFLFSYCSLKKQASSMESNKLRIAMAGQNK